MFIVHLPYFFKKKLPFPLKSEESLKRKVSFVDGGVHFFYYLRYNI